MTIPAALILATVAVWAIALLPLAVALGRATARHQRSAGSALRDCGRSS